MMVMNKDVVYIEPEDDITDILTRVKDNQAKIVALVPPKKANVLKSAVNFKLLQRTAKETGKAVVLVTTDAALLKLAAGAGLPVAKNLQSKPEVPVIGEPAEETAEPESDVIDGEEAVAIIKKEKKAGKADEKSVIESVDLEEEDSSSDSDEILEGEKGKDKSKKKKKILVPNFDKYRKFIIMGAVGLVLIVGFLIWAFVIAPSAKIMVTVRTSSRPFSEAVAFTTDEAKQDPSGGLFLLEEERLVKQSEVEFEATGQMDKGAKATGTLTLKRTSASSDYTSAITIAKGTKFMHGDLAFIATEGATLAKLDGSNTSCTGSIGNISCQLTKEVSATVKIEAEVPGTNHNIAATDSGWTPRGSGYSVASSAMTGGSSKVVKIVSAEDIAKAKQELLGANTSEGKEELLENFPTGLMAIAATFRNEAEEPVSTPAVGEEVGEGVTPKLVAKTTFAMFGVDRARIDEYIKEQTEQAIAEQADQKVYSTGVSDNSEENKAFIESFRENGDTYSARLKSVAKVGPEVTDQMVVEKSLGRKIGEVQSLLKSINGVSSVRVDSSFFWVSSVPNDTNKVSVEVTVE